MDYTSTAFMLIFQNFIRILIQSTFIVQLLQGRHCNRVKVLKNGPSKICGRQHLKHLKRYGLLCLGRPYHLKLFKGCLLQILLGPFLNTLTQLLFIVSFDLTWLVFLNSVAIQNLQCDINFCFLGFLRWNNHISKIFENLQFQKHFTYSSLYLTIKYILNI